MLYPVRVDAKSKDGLVRIVDSLLIDPSCLPIPTCATTTSLTHYGNNHLIKQTIQQNSKHLATTLVADAEVQSYGRLYKFSRLKLFEKYPELESAIESQISSQLRVIMEEAQITKKRKRKVYERNDLNNKEDESKNQKSEKNASSTNDSEDNDDLVKINIRLRTNQISIVDEIWVDPKHPMSDPLLLAESIARDLKLPESTINNLAISIAEQMCGLEVDNNVDGMLKLDDAAKAKSTSIPLPAKFSKVKSGVSCAWILDEKEKKVSDLLFKQELK